jgi:hypothetical protein
MNISYYLYLSTANCQESHSLRICSDANLTVIRDAISNIIRAMFERRPHWYSEEYVNCQADEMTMLFADLLKDGSPITKRKYPFYHLGFIITNYPMWPDNNGGYLSDFHV